MCDFDLVEYYQLLQEDSQKRNKKLSELDDRFKKLHCDRSLETNHTEKLTDTA